MKKFGLILALLGTVNVIGSKAEASQCKNVFANQEASQASTKNGADVLVDLFSLILKAPDKSKIEVFTNNLKFDGIGSLLLLVSVHESRPGRDLHFNFNLGDVVVSRAHDLLSERSTNKVRFRNSPTSSDVTTVVVIERNGESKTYQFNGELTSDFMKNASLKSTIPVNVPQQNILRASPFNDIVGIKQSSSKDKSDAIDVYQEVLDSAYRVPHTSRIIMTEDDAIKISNKAFDLALQLYYQKKGHSPKESLDAFQMLQQIVP